MVEERNSYDGTEEQIWWKSGTMMVEQRNRDGGKEEQRNRYGATVEQWNNDGGTKEQR